jgi:ribosomal protein S18 acetylase RimI-like enzyme
MSNEERLAGADPGAIRIIQVPPDQAPAWSLQDRSFEVDSELVLHLADGRLGYGVVRVAPYVKTYADGPHGAGLADGDGTLASGALHTFVAYLDGQPAGEMGLSQHWNGYASIDDVLVAQAFRRRGVGRALVLHAMAWSRARKLAGVVLETQNNNVAACRLYAACGFALRGFDADLYRGLAPRTREVALFWYWHAPPG